MLVDRVKYDNPVCRNISGNGPASMLCPLMIPINVAGTKSATSGGVARIPFRCRKTGLPLDPEKERPLTSTTSSLRMAEFTKLRSGVDAMEAILAIGTFAC